MLRSRPPFLLLTGLLVLALWVQAAAAATYTLTEKDSGQTVILRVGDTVRLDLRNPASGGYNVLTPVYDGQVLNLLSRRDLPPEKRPKPMMGDFGRIEFTWEARQPGETAVTVNIARPWEKDKPPEQYLKIRVLVGR